MQYRLTYNIPFNTNTVEKIANTEIELAAAILDMERDVGAVCYNVQITQGDFTEDRTSNTRLALQQIKRWATVLEKNALHIG